MHKMHVLYRPIRIHVDTVNTVKMHENAHNARTANERALCSIHVVHCEPKKGGSTFNIITLEKHARLLYFLQCCKQEETFYTLMKNMSTSPK